MEYLASGEGGGGHYAAWEFCHRTMPERSPPITELKATSKSASTTKREHPRGAVFPTGSWPNCPISQFTAEIVNALSYRAERSTPPCRSKLTIFS
eukprot:6004931-Amphidinium_carterae.1